MVNIWKVSRFNFLIVTYIKSRDLLNKEIKLEILYFKQRINKLNFLEFGILFLEVIPRFINSYEPSQDLIEKENHIGAAVIESSFGTERQTDILLHLYMAM